MLPTMARVQEPTKGRPIVSIIYSSLDPLSDSLKALERKFGPVQYETLEIDCSKTEMYTEEMGGDLLRRFFSFERLAERGWLADMKKICHKIEPNFADQTAGYDFRTVNIDPGILTPSNLLMASHRELNHRVYLKDGVYAELALIYARGQFRRLPWTNPDYCRGEAIEFFMRVHESFELAESAVG